QSSTLTGTLAGQVIMEGYLNIRIQPWLRRFITRMIAIIPAFFTILILGDNSAGKLLVLSQVILSMQLVFAMVPLLYFVANTKLMGIYKAKPLLLAAAWVCVFLILGLNIQWLRGLFSDFFKENHNIMIDIAVVVALALMAILTVYVFLTPLFLRRVKVHKEMEVPHLSALAFKLEEDSTSYKKIAITVDFSPSDIIAISRAIAEGGKEAAYLLIHVVETAGARFMQEEIRDFETSSDKKNVDNYVDRFKSEGYKAIPVIGYGNPKISIAEIVNTSDADLLVMGVHGHKTLKDLIFGTTIDKLRHKIKIPLLIVRQ
ncbi:MAG TPA: divalent metal cation transporter, partial [Bacteroidia bacterium]|nr:divalent metal cation transporter [Bacteroidia bacterium]